MARKIAARLAAAVVALVAGAASYQHIAAVALAAGEPDWVAYGLPLAIDGLIVVGVAALLEDKAANRHPRRSAWLAIVVGVAATLAANIASAEPTATARLVAAAPPVAFLIAIEVLTGRGRPRPVDPYQLDPATAAQAADALAVAVMQGDDTRGDSVAPTTSVTAVVDEAVTSENATKSPQTSERKPTHTQTPRKRGATAERVAKAVAKSPNATTAELAARLQLSERTIQRYRRQIPPTLTTANGHNGPADVSPHTDN